MNLQYDLPFPIYTLFLWSEEAPAVGHLIRTLKSGWGAEAWSGLAERFAKKFCATERRINRDWQFVPAPPQRKGQRDHAFLWARALSEVFQGSVSTVLTRTEGGAQKTRRLSERWQSIIENSDEQAIDSAKTYIFVDDLITSGATAQAAWIALGKPPSFQVWTLASRPKRRFPCGELANLL